MENNDIKNNESKEDSNNSSYRGIYFESEVDPMDVYRRRRNMARKYGSREKYASDQRLDDAKKKQKNPPDGYIFDR